MLQYEYDREENGAWNTDEFLWPTGVARYTADEGF